VDNEDLGLNRTYINDRVEARKYVQWLLQAPDCIFVTIFRMSKITFRKLCEWLRHNTRASGSRYQSLEQRVIVFLWLVAYNKPQRNTALRFQMSQASVSAIFHHLIGPMRLLYTRFIRQLPLEYMSSRVELDDRFYHFNSAIGAVDGIYIPAFVTRGRQKR
jgi:hypothetical protein